jgi:hypothetical protein
MPNSTITLPDDLIPAAVSLDECPDGNAFAVIAFVRQGLKRAGNSASTMNSYRDQAMSGDYDHLLRVSLAFTETES